MVVYSLLQSHPALKATSSVMNIKNQSYNSLQIPTMVRFSNTCSKSQYMHCASNQWWSDCKWGHCHSGVYWLRTYYFLPMQCWPPGFLSMWACASYIELFYNVFSDVIFYPCILHYFWIENYPSASMSCCWWSQLLPCLDLWSPWSKNISVRE